MTGLWTDKTAAEATGGKVQGEWQAMRVEIDSRRVKPGDLFVALKGENFDGHDFVAQAFAKGAAAAMVSKAVAEKNLLMVADTQKGLEALAAYARGRSKAKIVGVTGSVGKTGTKDMLRLALMVHGATYATTGNYNNHIGTPLNLANLPPETKLAVFEMGMNHAGEITPLSKMVRPHVAVITNVEAVHMEFFASLDAIADAKAEIFAGVEPGSTAVLNRDNTQFERLFNAAQKRGLNVVDCGVSGAECRLKDNVVTIGGKSITLKLKVHGAHWRLNAALVLAAVDALGLDIEKSARALDTFEEPEGRGRVIPLTLGGKPILLVDDSYNASPASMKASFAKTHAVWEDKKKGRKIAALGNMLELGEQTEQLHASLAPELVRCKFDKVFTCGDHMHHLYQQLPEPMRAHHASDALALLPLITREMQPGDILLIKGSHGSHMYELAAALKDAAGPKEKKTHAV